MAPLSQAASQHRPPLSSEETLRVFANVADLARLSEDLLKALPVDIDPPATSGHPSGAIPSPPSCQTERDFIQVLSTHLPFLAMYSTFITQFPAILTFLRSRRQSSDSFRKILAQAESSPQAAKLRLEDWLLTVVQRVPRWSLLLRELLSVTDVDTEAHDLLKRLVLKVDHSRLTSRASQLTYSCDQPEPAIPRTYGNPRASRSTALLHQPPRANHQARSQATQARFARTNEEH